jgi:hypothetical protein
MALEIPSGQFQRSIFTRRKATLFNRFLPNQTQHVTAKYNDDGRTATVWFSDGSKKVLPLGMVTFVS